VNNQKDYVLTIDTAKQIAMMENNDKGKEIRRYFLDCENIALQKKPLTSLDLIIASAQQLQQQEQAIQDHEARLHYIESKAITSDVQFFTVSGYLALK
jgi:anti-repressor protein